MKEKEERLEEHGWDMTDGWCSSPRHKHPVRHFSRYMVGNVHHRDMASWPLSHRVGTIYGGVTFPAPFPLDIDNLAMPSAVLHGGTFCAGVATSPLASDGIDAPAAAPGHDNTVERAQRRCVAADDTQVRLDGRPGPQVEPFPGDVVCLLYHVVGPVGSLAAGYDDDETTAEEQGEHDALVSGKAQLQHDWQRQHDDDDVSDNGGNCLGP